MRIINDLNHNDWGSKGNIYECTIQFDSEEQMDRVLENFDSKDIFLDFHIGTPVLIPSTNFLTY